jgi:hypothetical protein
MAVAVSGATAKAGVKKSHHGKLAKALDDDGKKSL